MYRCLCQWLGFWVLVCCLGACESAADVYAELAPELKERVAQLNAAPAVVGAAGDQPAALRLDVDPPPRFCRARVCRSDGRGAQRTNARVMSLWRLEHLDDPERHGPVRVALGRDWLIYALAFAKGTTDPGGRSLDAWYPPTLREMMQRVIDLRYALVFVGRPQIDRWALLAGDGELLRLGVEEPGSGPKARRTVVEGSFAGVAYFYDLVGARLLGGVPFATSGEGRATPYRGDEAIQLRADLERQARALVDQALAAQLPAASLPFSPDGDFPDVD